MTYLSDYASAARNVAEWRRTETLEVAESNPWYTGFAEDVTRKCLVSQLRFPILCQPGYQDAYLDAFGGRVG